MTETSQIVSHTLSVPNGGPPYTQDVAIGVRVAGTPEQEAVREVVKLAYAQMEFESGKYPDVAHLPQPLLALWVEIDARAKRWQDQWDVYPNGWDDV